MIHDHVHFFSYGRLTQLQKENILYLTIFEFINLFIGILQCAQEFCAYTIADGMSYAYIQFSVKGIFITVRLNLQKLFHSRQYRSNAI